MAGQGERPVDAAGGHLERVGLLAHHVAAVEHLGDLPGRVGDVVEGDPAVAVDGDPEDPALAGRRQLDRLDIEAEGGKGRVSPPRSESRSLQCRLACLAGAHRCDLLVLLW